MKCFTSPAARFDGRGTQVSTKTTSTGFETGNGSLCEHSAQRLALAGWDCPGLTSLMANVNSDN